MQHVRGMDGPQQSHEEVIVLRANEVGVFVGMKVEVEREPFGIRWGSYFDLQGDGVISGVVFVDFLIGASCFRWGGKTRGSMAGRTHLCAGG